LQPPLGFQAAAARWPEAAAGFPQQTGRHGRVLPSKKSLRMQETEAHAQAQAGRCRRRVRRPGMHMHGGCVMLMQCSGVWRPATQAFCAVPASLLCSCEDADTDGTIS